MKKTLLLLLSCLSFSLAAIAQNIIYVNINVSGGANNGTSWANAYNNLATAIDNASEGKQIWVAKGAYRPANYASFSMKHDVAIYGGFTGGETSLSQRNYVDNPTMLEAYGTTRVFFNNDNNLTASAILDGFSLINTSVFNQLGSPTIRNCSFTQSNDECIYNQDSSPIISNCVFIGNNNNSIYNKNSSPSIVNCVFKENMSDAVANYLNSSPTIVNCVFTKNSVSSIYNEAPASATIINTTFADNVGNALFSTNNSMSIIRNSIVWGGVVGTYTASHSLIKGKADISNGNIDASGVTENQIFTNYAGGDYTLKAGSAALNSGDNSLYTGLSASTLDLSGNRRLISGKIDIGAYEHQTLVITPDANNIVYVNINADGTGDGSSWAHATTQLQAAINGSPTNGGQVWVAKGTYQPATYESFNMRDNVAIYGGFVGSETSLSQRNYKANLTILQGNNSYVVFNVNSLTVTAILDGFTITGGQTFYGSGMHNEGASPTVSNCVFKGNHADSEGGAMSNWSSSPIIIGCLFTDNHAGSNGDAISNWYDSSPVIINSTIAGNGNKAIYNSLSTTILNNSIVWGSTIGSYTAKNSLIKDNTDTSNGNIDANGLTEASIFNDYTNGDYTLKAGSAALNSGDNSLYTGLSASTLDLAGNRRLISGKIDLGAYESQVLVITPDANNIVYVNSSADGTGNGSSWVNATTQLQAAIDGLPQSGGQVWVAKGNYQPASGSSFKMKKEVAIYGGFAGGETALTERSYAVNPTFLFGSGGVHSVIFNENNGLTATAILDGFRISGGNAVYGAGIYNDNVSPTIRNCVFIGNLAFQAGGAMANISASAPIIANCIFTNNMGMLQGGEAIYNSASSPTIVNSTILSNNNVGLYNISSTVILQNSIVWGDVSGDYTASHSLLKGKADVSNGNIDASGLTETDIFNNIAFNDYSLKVGSRAINKGNNAWYTATGGNLSTEKDLAGNPRLNGGTIDLGAYEYQSALPVVFDKFSATLQNNRVKLAWNTFSETNNQAFRIYRSSDGVNYTEIVRQVSKSNGANSYIAYDNSPLNGLNYYRLKQQDTDGSITELGDEAVNFSLRNEEIKAWPNPVEKILKLSFPAGKYQSLRLTDMSGRKLQELTLNKTQSELALDMSNYPKGVYLITLKGSNGHHLLKVFK